MSRWLRILVGLGIAVVACGAYLWFFGVQTFFIWETRRVARKEPVVWTTPVPLLDLSISQAIGKKLSYFGYEFEVPWDDIDQEKSKVIGTNKAIIAFRSGNVISFWAGPPNELISTLQSHGKIDQKSLGQLQSRQPPGATKGGEKADPSLRVAALGMTMKEMAA